MLKTEKGITLVALIITIIVLLILAGVSISMISGNNGLATKARTAVNVHNNAVANENQYFLEENQVLHDAITTAENQINAGHTNRDDFTPTP